MFFQVLVDLALCQNLHIDHSMMMYLQLISVHLISFSSIHKFQRNFLLWRNVSEIDLTVIMRKIHVINEKFIEVQIENVVHAVLSEIKKSYTLIHLSEYPF